ncbi:MAG: YdcF family protein [Paracoccaceae bacterium]|nr:YdcF family protein [Paracoccaceae bacterium]
MVGRTSRRVGPYRKAMDRLAGLVIFIGTIWIAGLFWFGETIPDHLEDEASRTDAIAVLTGGSGRLNTGLDLLSRGVAGKLYISGVYEGTDITTLLDLSRREPGSFECCLVIGYAQNTIGNARETTDWMRKEGFSSLRIVTSGYHMPRALLEFRFALPGIEAVPHPVFSENVKQDRWWAWPGTAALIISEYNKYLVAWLRHGAMRLLPRGEGA